MTTKIGLTEAVAVSLLAETGRRHHLKAAERMVLVVVAVEGRGGEWVGTAYALKELVGCTWRTVVAAVDHLVACDLLELAEPFGRNSEGTLRLTAQAVGR